MSVSECGVHLLRLFKADNLLFKMKPKNLFYSLGLVQALSSIREQSSLVTVEPVMFLYEMSIAVHASIDQSIVMDKICVVGSFWFGNGWPTETKAGSLTRPNERFFSPPGTTYPEDVCETLDNGENEEVQKYVQVSANKFKAVHASIVGVLNVVFLLFGGAWSDRYGNARS